MKLSSEARKKLQLLLTWFWIANFPPVIILYFAVDNETFQKLILLYVLVS
jgi:hypothetical protein